MTRKKKLFYNTLAGILKQIVTIVCGFILPRYMLLYYGSAVNGVIASIANYLSFISLLDMGVGAVVQANLYKPLADKDNTHTSEIVISSERFFRRLGCIFIGYIAVLCFVFPNIVNKSFNAWFTVTLLIFISISTLAQYLFGMTYQLLLNADQKSYVHLFLQIGTIVLNTGLAIVLMRMGASVHLVKLMTAVVYVLRPIGQAIYVKRHYSINRKIKIVGEPIKQKWNGFSQHLAAVVCQNIDIMVLTMFSTLENVSVYSVYFNVTNGVEMIVLTAATGLEPLFGDMIAKGEKNRLTKTFNTIEWLFHTGVTFIFVITGLCIVQFVIVYTKGVNDAEYIAPIFGAVLVIAYGIRGLRVPYFSVIKAAGHFKQTEMGAYVSAILNIVITVILVFRFGLIGAASGTLIAMLYHTCYFVWYLQKEILQRPVKEFIKYVAIDLIIILISFFATRFIVFSGTTYLAWVIFATRVALIVLIVSSIVNVCLCRNQIKETIRLIKK